MANAVDVQGILELTQQLVQTKLRAAEIEARIRKKLDASNDEPDSLRVPPTNKQRIFEHVVSVSPKITNPRIVSDKLGIPITSVYTLLGELFEEGLISRIGQGAYLLPIHVKKGAVS